MANSRNTLLTLFYRIDQEPTYEDNQGMTAKEQKLETNQRMTHIPQIQPKGLSVNDSCLEGWTTV